jgi:hypothetical protein
VLRIGLYMYVCTLYLYLPCLYKEKRWRLRPHETLKQFLSLPILRTRRSIGPNLGLVPFRVGLLLPLMSLLLGVRLAPSPSTLTTLSTKFSTKCQPHDPAPCLCFLHSYSMGVALLVMGSSRVLCVLPT